MKVIKAVCSPLITRRYQSVSKLCTVVSRATRNTLNVRKYSTVQYKTPKESKKLKILDFGKDERLRSKYISPFGALRFGLLLEELDSLAGAVAYSHAAEKESEFLQNILVKPRADVPMQSFESPLTIVTASCHNIKLLRALDPMKSLHMEGVVSWVGRSSMEIKISVFSVDNESKQLSIEALFNMVARDKQNKAVPVVPLRPETEEEILLYKQGEENARRRKAESTLSLENKPPTDEERQIIHDLYLSTKKFTSCPENCVRISETALQTTILMQPQERNIHNKIFGGYLMRKAFELAFSTAYSFGTVIPKLKAIDDIKFVAPVSIGDIAIFSALVNYAQDDGVEVSVAADVLHPQSNKRTTTNVFYFSFMCPQLRRKVIPYSYDEVVKMIEGRRKLLAIPLESQVW